MFFRKKKDTSVYKQVQSAILETQGKCDKQLNLALEKQKYSFEEEISHLNQEHLAKQNLLEKEISYLKDQIEYQQKITESNYRISKTNLRIATELKFNADRFLSQASDIFKNINALFDDTESHHRTISKQMEVQNK